MCAPYTYIHITHLTFCGRTLKHTLLEIVYEEENEAQNKTMAIFLELHDNSISFTPFLPRPSPHTLHTSYVQECNSLLPTGSDNNMIFVFQKCDTFGRTTKGRTWLASQDHPLYTQLIWTSTIKTHHRLTIVELSKLKSIAFGRNSPSVRVKPSCAEAS